MPFFRRFGSSPGGWSAWLFLLLLVLLGAVYAWPGLGGSDDFWTHAAVGRWIWQNRQVPDHTLFLWTPAIVWIDHEWLSQVAFFGLLSAGGDLGPTLVRYLVVVLVLVPFGLLWFLWKGRVTSLMPVLFVLGIHGSSGRFEARPEAFSAVFLAGLLTFLVSWSPPSSPPETGRPAFRDQLASWLWLPLFVVWANCHGLVFLGVALLAATAACDLVQDRFDARSRRLALVALLAAAAVFLNPYGFHYWQALALIRGTTLQHIKEWAPLWVEPATELDMVLPTGLLWFLAVLAWARTPRRRGSHLAWLLLLAASLLRARRFLWLTNLVSLAVLAANAHALDPEQLWQLLWRRHRQEDSRAVEPPPIPPSWRRWARVAVLGWLGIYLAVMAGGLRQNPAKDPAVPDQIARAVQEHRPPGQMFNDYEHSGYFEWCYGGHPPLYIDLLNAYPDEVFQDYLEIVNLTPRGLKLLDRGEIGYVVLITQGRGLSMQPLGDYLDRNPHWQHVYGTREGSVWVRRTPGSDETHE
ncbi:MAG: hypothetical protein JO112_16315 [Planctomycetes bacterium]|nr:hypothetical protein [Planctomycetota bacterium]